MKTLIDIENWNRKSQYLFFSKFEEPFFGVTVKVDCTKAYLKAKEENVSFFLYYLYRALRAANEIENFRLRIIDNQVYKFSVVNASPTIDRPDGTFGFAYMDFYQDAGIFYENALKEIENVKRSNNLMPAVTGENVIHFSALPWLDFTSISHARCFSFPDSCPKISFGKFTEENGIKSMPVSVFVNHALADGFHIGQFIELFQKYLDC